MTQTPSREAEASLRPCPLLQSISSPAQIATLSDAQLAELAEEVRCRIVDVVSHTGGHLAPSLGVTDLTLALLSCFNFEQDKLIWDVAAPRPGRTG